MAGDSVEKIKERLSIVDVISPYVELHNAGKNLKGKSPFTNEKTPSFYVSPDRGMYYCFSSSQGGDMFTFVEKMEGVDFKGALKILAEKAGVELVPEDPKQRSERDTQYQILEEATKFFEAELGKNKEAEEYLKKRGVKGETIKKWRIGYVPGPPKNGWRHTREHLKQLKFSDQELIKAGLIKTAGEGKEPYDVFRDRVMFPIFDASGRVVAYSGRVLAKASEAPKYVNSPETELFKKSEILYGYDKAKEGIRKFDFSLIVEGQFDVVLAHQAGYTNTVAVSGTALTAHHVGLLQRLSQRVVLALDADRAGVSAVKRAADVMLSRGIDLKVARLPDGQDPADIVAEDVAKLKKIIADSKHVIEFLLKVTKEEAKDERSYKLQVRDEVLPYVLKLVSHIDRDHFIGVIAENIGTTKEAIGLDVARLEAKRKPETSGEEKKKEVKQGNVSSTNRLDNLRNYFLVIVDLISEDDATVIRSHYREITGEDFEKEKKKLSSEESSRLAFNLEKSLEELSDHARLVEFTETLSEFATLTLKEKIKSEKQLLSEAENRGDEKEVEKLLANINSLQQKLKEAKYSLDIFKQ